MPQSKPVIGIDLPDPELAGQAAARIEKAFGGRLGVTTDPAGAPVRVGTVEEAPDAPPPGGQTFVALGDLEPPRIVDLLRGRPWLNHLTSPQVLEDDGWGTTLPGALWRILNASYVDAAPFFGKEFQGRRVMLRDSRKLAARCEQVARFAADFDVPPTVVERVRGITEELLTNALWDAPAEARGVPADRLAPVLLPPEQACSLTYGIARNMFFVRVRDYFGSLRRERLLEVLHRCARADGDVALDGSRGGAGLGMWRIFNAAVLFVVEVKPGLSTEVLIGIDVQRRRSRRGRAVHLFFDPVDPIGPIGPIGPTEAAEPAVPVAEANS